jgi:hypothetical protein
LAGWDIFVRFSEEEARSSVNYSWSLHSQGQRLRLELSCPDSWLGDIQSPPWWPSGYIYLPLVSSQRLLLRREWSPPPLATLLPLTLLCKWIHRVRADGGSTNLKATAHVPNCIITYLLQPLHRHWASTFPKYNLAKIVQDSKNIAYTAPHPEWKREARQGGKEQDSTRLASPEPCVP